MTATWIAIGVLALVTFGIGMLIAREGRQVWTLLASAMIFALAGYAWQGAPDVPAAPRQAVETVMPASEALIDVRRGFYNVEGIQPSRYVVIADGFSRKGQHIDAAGLLRNGVSENPEDGEAWLALALALSDHTRGRVTPPVAYAFERARAASQGSPAPAYFQGLMRMRMGDLGGARDFWRQAVEDASEDARGREYVAAQLERLEGVINVLGENPRAPRAPMMQAPATPQ